MLLYVAQSGGETWPDFHFDFYHTSWRLKICFVSHDDDIEDVIWTRGPAMLSGVVGIIYRRLRAIRHGHNSSWHFPLFHKSCGFGFAYFYPGWCASASLQSKLLSYLVITLLIRKFRKFRIWNSLGLILIHFNEEFSMFVQFYRRESFTLRELFLELIWKVSWTS